MRGPFIEASGYQALSPYAPVIEASASMVATPTAAIKTSTVVTITTARSTHCVLFLLPVLLHLLTLATN